MALAALLPVRVIRDRARFHADVRTRVAVTSVAGTALLGTRLALLGSNTARVALLLVIAAVIWAGLLVPVLRHWKTPTVGASLLLAVSSEALAALAATLGASEHGPWPWCRRCSDGEDGTAIGESSQPLWRWRTRFAWEYGSFLDTPESFPKFLSPSSATTRSTASRNRCPVVGIAPSGWLTSN